MVNPVNHSKFLQDSQQASHYGSEGKTFRTQGAYKTVTMVKKSIIPSAQQQLLYNHAFASQTKVLIMQSLPNSYTTESLKSDACYFNLLHEHPREASFLCVVTPLSTLPPTASQHQSLFALGQQKCRRPWDGDCHFSKHM